MKRAGGSNLIFLNLQVEDELIAARPRFRFAAEGFTSCLRRTTRACKDSSCSRCAKKKKAASTDYPGGTGSRHCSLLSFACPRPPDCIGVRSLTESRSNGKPQENFDLLQGPMLTAQDFSLRSQGHPRRRMPGGLSMGHVETGLEVAINASS